MSTNLGSLEKILGQIIGCGTSLLLAQAEGYRHFAPLGQVTTTSTSCKMVTHSRETENAQEQAN